MSNLGAYQTVTTVIKAMGGPAKATMKAVGSVVAGIGIAYRLGVNTGAKRPDGNRIEIKILDAVRSKLRRGTVKDSVQVYTATADDDYGGGLTLHTGDTFTAGRVIDDMVYIEVVGNDNNPYLVSAKLLAQNSNFSLNAAQDTDPGAS